MARCALCKRDTKLLASHIIPKFVWDSIKQGSPSGYFRMMDSPDRRLQDGDKKALLCSECEQLFSKWEMKFAEVVFKPYRNEIAPPFDYGPWLLQFISSVVWRTLYLDCIGFGTDVQFAEMHPELFFDAEEKLRSFLLDGAPALDFDTHMYFIVGEAQTSSPELQQAGPNVFLHTSAFCYSLNDITNNGYYVWGNLAGVLFAALLQPGPDEVWKNTLVGDAGTFDGNAQEMTSMLANELFDLMQKRGKASLSYKQAEKLRRFVRENPERVRDSRFLKHLKADSNLRD